MYLLLLHHLVPPGADLHFPRLVGHEVFDPPSDHHLAAVEGGLWVRLVPLGQLGGEELVVVEGALRSRVVLEHPLGRLDGPLRQLVGVRVVGAGDPVADPKPGEELPHLDAREDRGPVRG